MNCDINVETIGPEIFVVTLPPAIVGEVWLMAEACRKIKEHPLAALKQHENAGFSNEGERGNNYQCAVPVQLIDNSYWLALILRLVAAQFGGYHRDYMVRRYTGHFDAYDVWTNFAYKGDYNPPHIHSAAISGVIYVKNHEHPTIFTESGVEYTGKEGTMVFFPSDTEHMVEEQTSDKERITIAFNVSKQAKRRVHRQFLIDRLTSS